MQTAVLQEIVPGGLTYSIDDRRTRSEHGIPVEVIYTAPFDKAWQYVWYGRRNHGDNIYNRSGVWRFREAVNWLGIDMDDPRVCARHLVSLDGEENSRIGPYHLYNVAKYVDLDNSRLSFLMFGKNPSGSFKDGGIITLLTQAKNLGYRLVIVASTGNTAESLSGAVANEMAAPYNEQYLYGAIVVIPRGRVAPGKLLGALRNRAKIIEVEGEFGESDFSVALSYVREVENSDRPILVANSVVPFRIEGQKTEMYAVMEAQKWANVPDWIVTPGGNYGSTAAAHKAFKEWKEAGWIDRYPRLAIVNAALANTVERLHKRGVRWNNGNVDHKTIEEVYGEVRAERRELDIKGIKTKMSAIDIAEPAYENLMKTLRALDEMNGTVLSVTDEEAWEAKEVIDSNGPIGGAGVDLASAATVAGIKKLRERGDIESSHVVVGRITGRDKDEEASSNHYLKANPPLRVRTREQFIKALYELKAT
jgi:threonine synthase